MNAPAVTVLMPVYNGAKHLQEAIDSILEQSFKDFELLIIDDGSTDDSLALIKAYHDPRIRLSQNGGNLGLVATLNKGLDLARGHYIARMDCDDIALPTRLQKQVAFLDRHPHIGLCGTCYQWFSGSNAIDVALPEDDAAIRIMLAFQNAFGHFTVMLRREVIAAHGLRYDPGYKYAEDYEFWTRCAQATKMANLPEALVRYRFHPENTSSAFRGEQKRMAAHIRDSQLAVLDLHPSARERRLHHQLAEHAFSGTLEDLALAGSWLETVAAALAARLEMPFTTVCRYLGLTWYLACGVSAGQGLTAWKLFMRSPLGRRAKPMLIFKLLLRCLLRHPIPHNAL